MTLLYPDISAYNAGISIADAEAVCIKVTEGTGWLNSDYEPAMGRARQAGAFAFAYHFLHAGNAPAQAAWAHEHAGTTPMMVDCEPTSGSNPSVGDAESFVDAYRNLGGICHLIYFPHWYWQQIGSPSLTGFVTRNCYLVSSAYTSYTDASNGTGWMPYGGMTPSVWQYTDAHSFNGESVDFNAYRGTLAEFEAMVGGSAPPPPPPPPPGQGPNFPYPATDYLGMPSPNPHCHSGYYGGPDTVNVHTWQAQMAARGAVITLDGRYGPQSDAVCKAFQGSHGLAQDGLVGPQTWAASWA